MKRFGEAVGDLLLDRGLTQRELAQAAYVDPAHISRLLRRERPTVSPDLLTRVADALGVPPDHFLEFQEWQLIELIRSDPALCERLHRRLVRRASRVVVEADKHGDRTH